MSIIAAQIAQTLADLKAAPTAADSIIYDHAIFKWSATSGAPADDVNVIASDDTGFWSRQKAEKVEGADGATVQDNLDHGGYFQQPEPGAIVRPTSEHLIDLPASVFDFGAVGDGIANDTVAIQAALDSGRSLHFPDGKTFLLKKKLTLSTGGVSLSGKGVIKIAADFDVSGDTDGTGPVMRAIFINTGVTDINVSDIGFDCTLSPVGSGRNSACIWSQGANVTISGCHFVKHPKGAAIVGTQYSTWLKVSGCHFYDCTGAVFIQGRSPNIIGNTIINCSDAAIALNGPSCVGGVVKSNVISNEGTAPIPSMIALEEGASNWVIVGNTLMGVSGGGIICTNISYLTSQKGGVIADNIVDGARFDGSIQSSSNPSVLLYISPYYSDWIAHDNKVINCPTGRSNSRHAIVAATGGMLHNNIIDGTATPGLSSMVSILAGSGGITISSNITRAAANGRHFLFETGDYGNIPVSFRGGKFFGGSVGIDSELNWSAGISNFVLNIENVSHSTVSPTLINAASAIGDRAKFMNSGAWARPHRIGVFTDMSCNAIPNSAGALTYQIGDKFYYMSPANPGYIGIYRKAGGWGSFGATA